MSAQVIQALQLDLSKIETDLFDLLFFVNHHSVLIGLPTDLPSEHRDLFNRINFPVKPTFLNAWSLDDWHYFVLFASATNLFSQKFPLVLRNTSYPLYEKEVATWIHCYETEYRELTKEEKQVVKEGLWRSIILNEFISVDRSIFELLHLIDFDEFSSLFPYYYRKFLTFWSHLTKALPRLNDDYLKAEALFAVLQLYPIKEELAPVRVFLSTELTILFKRYFELRLENKFRNKYTFDFVTESKNAEIIIGTHLVSDSHSRKIPTVLICPSLTENDFIVIEKSLNNLLKNRKELNTDGIFS